MVRIGIIGVGSMGGAHAKYLAGGNVSGAKLTALCDTDEARRQTLAQTFPDAAIFASDEELFESGLCDAVVIATPHYFHPEIGIRALQKGLHVLTEKPIAVQCSRARAFVQAAKENGRTLAVMFNQRTEPIFGAARELVQSGALGEPKRFDWTITNWYRTQAYYRSGSWRATWCGEGGGVLMNQAPHQLDLWQWIFGMPSALHAECPIAQYHEIEVEDSATILAEYENGATAVFRTSTGEFPGTNRLEITGDLGKLVLEDGVLKHWKLREPERKVCFTAEEAHCLIPMDFTQTAFAKKDHPHGAVLQNFADHIENGTPLIAPGEEALHALAIANAAYLSAWTGKKISLPADEALFDRLLEEKKQSSALRKSTAQSAVGGYTERWQVRW